MKQGAIQNQQAEKLHWEVNADHEKIASDQRRKNEVEVANVFPSGVCSMSIKISNSMRFVVDIV